MPGLSRRKLAAMALAAVSGSLARAAHAQREFPSRPIRWIVPYPPGAIADIVARTVGTQLAIDTGQPVQIENRAGGNTALGAIEAARAPADGYTVLSTDNGTLVFNPALYRNLSYDPARDFAPVTLLGRLPMVLLVGPSSGVKDARAFIADARAFPGKVSFASAGTGTVQHLAMELLQRQAGLRMVHVPYRGAAPALADLAGGQLPAMMSDLAAANRFIQGGKARALAVANATRLPQLPAVPTFAELGLPRVEAAALLGLAVPAGTPPELVARLQQAMASAIHNPVVLRKLAEFGVEPVGGTPARFEALIGDETARWHPLIKSLNLSLD
ncbi:Bug family tripartite tricarboxylate transporter substrate binding protein [Variovorax boronicumulans]